MEFTRSLAASEQLGQRSALASRLQWLDVTTEFPKAVLRRTEIQPTLRLVLGKSLVFGSSKWAITLN